MDISRLTLEKGRVTLEKEILSMDIPRLIMTGNI
jgi:hypothetical protein